MVNEFNLLYLLLYLIKYNNIIMPNLNLNNAAETQYFDGHIWISSAEYTAGQNHDRWCCRDPSKVQNPNLPGYTSENIAQDSGNCYRDKKGCNDWDGYINKQTIDKNSEHWEPLLAKLRSSDGYSEENVEKVHNCCYGLLTKDDPLAKECGSLYYQDGTDTIRAPECKIALSKWCLNKDNINKEECYSTITDNIDIYRQVLRDKICKDKNPKDNPDYDRLCACNYNYSVYNDLAKEINAVWNVPINLIGTQPECIYPVCKISATRDKTIDCPITNFTQCTQSNNINIMDKSTVGSIDIKDNADCAIYSKLTKDGTTSTPTPTSSTPTSNTDDAKKKADDAKKATTSNFWKILLFIVFIAVIAIGVVMFPDSSSKKLNGGYDFSVFNEDSNIISPIMNY